MTTDTGRHDHDPRENPVPQNAPPASLAEKGPRGQNAGVVRVQNMRRHVLILDVWPDPNKPVGKIAQVRIPGSRYDGDTFGIARIPRDWWELLKQQPVVRRYLGETEEAQPALVEPPPGTPPGVLVDMQTQVRMRKLAPVLRVLSD